MANIGTFTTDKDGFTGTLRTLTLNVKVKLVPNDKGDNEKAPDYRVQAAGHDIGAAWNKTSEAGREYKSVSLDDPSFPAPVYARLIENEDGTHDLIWSQHIITSRARLRRVALLQHRLQLPAHLRQQLVGLVRAIARVGQRQQRERVDLHHLAQLGQLAQGRAFEVAFEGTHVGAAGHVREGFLAQATRLSDRLQRLCQ